MPKAVPMCDIHILSELSRLRESVDLECKLAAGRDASMLRSPQSGRSWLSSGPGPGFKSPRFVRLAERAQACAGRLPSTPCGSHMLAQGRAASAETLGWRSLHFSDPLRVAQRLAGTLCDPQGVGIFFSWLTQGRGDPGLPCATRRGSSDKLGLRLFLPRRGSRQIAQGVGRGTRANPGWGIPPIRAPEGRPEANRDGQTHSARPAGAPVDFSSHPGFATRSSSLHPGLTSDRPSRAQIEWHSSVAASCKDDLQVPSQLCRPGLSLHTFRQPASLRKFRKVRSAGYLIRLRSQPNAQGLTHV